MSTQVRASPNRALKVAARVGLLVGIGLALSFTIALMTLGWYLTSPSLAARIHRCEHVDNSSCFAVGQVFERGVDAAPDLHRAVSYYNLACTDGTRDACARLLEMVTAGQIPESWATSDYRAILSSR